MAVYQINNAASPFAAVEFTPVSEGNITFFYSRDPEKDNDVRERIESLGQTILSQAKIGNPSSLDERTVYITRGKQSKDDLADALKASGDVLALETGKRKTNWWAFRGWASNVGQVMQLYSAFYEPKKVNADGKRVRNTYAPDQGAFAILNLLANLTNIIFGGQKEKDKYRLLYLKQNQNQLIAGRLPAGVTAPDINKSHSEIREEPKKLTLGQQFYKFMQKNSVTFGEIGLRFLGSIALVLPYTNFAGKKVNGQITEIGAFQLFKSKNYGEAFRTAFKLNKNRYTLASGLTYLFGKTIALFSKVPDPYNPKKESTLDQWRRKYFFKTASAIETGAAGLLAYSNYDQKKYVGAVGGTIFMGGLTTRFLAPFGSRQVNLEEVFAHTSDALALVPKDQLAQAVAESAALLATDLDGVKDISFGKIYTRLSTDLYRYHNISFEDKADIKEENAAHALNAPDPTAKPEQPIAVTSPASQLAAASARQQGLGFTQKLDLAADATPALQIGH